MQVGGPLVSVGHANGFVPDDNCGAVRFLTGEREVINGIQTCGLTPLKRMRHPAEEPRNGARQKAPPDLFNFLVWKSLLDMILGVGFRHDVNRLLFLQ